MTRNPQRSRSRGTERFISNSHLTRIRYYDEHGELVLDEDQVTNNDESITSPQQYCFDTVGYRKTDNPLFLSYETTSPAKVILNASNYSEWGLGTRRADVQLNYSTASFPVAAYPDSYPDDDIEFITHAAASSNPSKASVSGAVFMAELRDLPSLFRSTGATLSKFGANEYLKYQYGWKPFVSDLRKLFSVVSRIEKRMNVINRLRDGGVLRHNFNPPDDANSLKVHNEGFTTDIYTGYYIDGAVIGYSISSEIKTRRWADIVWVADPPAALNLASGSNATNFETARNAVYGLNIDGPTLWAAMPWSWLIDWVHNVDDYVKSQNNTIGAKFGNAVLMRQSEVVTTATPLFIDEAPGFAPSSTTFVKGTKRQVYKERILGIEPGIVQTGDFTSIIDDDFKLSILGALAIQRLRR